MDSTTNRWRLTPLGRAALAYPTLDAPEAIRAYLAARALWGADAPRTRSAARQMEDALAAAEAAEYEAEMAFDLWKNGR